MSRVYTDDSGFASSERSAKLDEAHRKMLVEGSAIDPAVITERGVRTVRSRDLPPTYNWRQKQRAPGILFTVNTPNGETSTMFRPDKPNPKKPGHKYECECNYLGGAGNRLDIHPAQRHLVDDVAVPALITEGLKKAYAITTAARREGANLLVVGAASTYGWMAGGEPIPDMFDIEVKGRRVYICFDSDMCWKPGVQRAAEDLALHLTRRGAEVWLVFLPDMEDGAKMGADDYLASSAGGTLRDLLGLARPFGPESIQREKLSRSEKLRLALAYLTGREEEMPAKTQRDCSKRAAWRAGYALALRRGKLVADGVEVIIPSMTAAEMAAMSQPTLSKCLTDLVEDGYLRRIKRQRGEDADRYVLLTAELGAKLAGGVLRYNEGERGEAERPGDTENHHGYNVIPPLDSPELPEAEIPELRWSSPSRKGKRGTVKDTRRVRQGRDLSEAVEGIYRFGKKRQEIVAYLVEQGGETGREELLEAFGGPNTQWCDFKRQTLGPLLGRRRRYGGQDLALGPPLIELTEDGIRLVDDWREALERHRELGQEEEAARKQKRDHMMQRIAYRRRNETPPDDAPTEEEMDEENASEERQKRRSASRLVAEGMAARFVAKDVFGADGFIGDLTREPDEPSEAEAEPAEPAEHGLACECLECSARAPSYATYHERR